MENYKLKKKELFLKVYIKMKEKQLQNLVILKSKKKTFTYTKDLYVRYIKHLNRDINKIVVSIKQQYLFPQRMDLYISLATNMLKKIKPLCKFPPKMSAYRKDFDETKYISF